MRLRFFPWGEPQLIASNPTRTRRISITRHKPQSNRRDNMRYHVFKTKEGGQPVFTAPWYWLASTIANWTSLKWDACRIVDSKVNETRLCWAKALPAEKTINLVE
ncbi:TPA: hypothetical protein PXQ68_001724 [Yersinia enterocolitica]|nr:hypothetical protein [Yersinia enterocolitica]